MSNAPSPMRRRATTQAPGRITPLQSKARRPPPAAQNTTTVRRVALVIGNGAYTHVKALPNPSNDARSIAGSLPGIGFVVSEGIDLDRAAMQTTIREFLREAAHA